MAEKEFEEMRSGEQTAKDEKAKTMARAKERARMKKRRADAQIDDLRGRATLRALYYLNVLELSPEEARKRIRAEFPKEVFDAPSEENTAGAG